MKEYINQVNNVEGGEDKEDQSTPSMHDNIESLFQPDSVVTFQYFDNLRRKTLLEPEKRLMLAILENAINGFQDNVLAESGKARELFEEAEEWILEGDDDWIFCFENICEVLGFDSRYLRLGLLRWKHSNCKIIKNRHLGGHEKSGGMP